MMRVLALLLVYVCLAHGMYDVPGDDGNVHFNDHVVVRAYIWSWDVVVQLSKLDFDVWSRDGAYALGENDIMLHRDQLAILEGLSVNYEVLIEDVEEGLAAERTQLMSASDNLGAWHDAYHQWADISAWYKNVSTSYSTIARFVDSIGKTVEGRDIPAIHIGRRGATKKIYFQGCQHAREWISAATVMYIVDQLTSRYGKDDDATKFVNEIEFVIVPVLNIDGYIYTWTTNRLWRKNRAHNAGGTYGVDTNRNWDANFGGEGSSNTPSSDTYHGPKAFSEPETAAASKYIKSSGPFAGAIDFHSYSQLILRPLGWTTTPPPDEATRKTVGDSMATAIRGAHSMAYTSEPSWQLYYTSGAAQDWFFITTGGNIPLSYTIELRDTGRYGFQLPPDQIIPTGEEIWAAMKYYINYILSH